MDTKSYAELFAREYVGPVFYYCLKKTGSREHAEDLASDITLAVLHALSHYPPPEKFPSWVWKIAHNRYARWCERVTRHREYVSGTDIGDYDIAVGEQPEDAVIESEQYSLLRRELAFIASEYRELIAAHYLDGVGITELSHRLGIPAGTVKTRLFKARKILKEGMDMAREFGKRSYAPEEVSFTSSGNHTDGLPFSAVQRSIPKNILLEASNNPSTAEELAMELGIALAYMEEEIGLLEKATLLKKLDNGKYITNFFIADKECQVEIYNAQRRESPTCARLLAEAVNDKYDELKALISPTVGETEFKWTLYDFVIDALICDMKGFTYANFNRPNGGNWGFLGYEQHNLIKEKRFVNHNCVSVKSGSFAQFANFAQGFKAFDWNDMPSLTLALFVELLMGGRRVEALTDSEKHIWDDIAKRYAHMAEDGTVAADVLVLRDGAHDRMMEILRAHPLVAELEHRVEALFCEVREILKRNSNAVLHESLDYYASSFMCDVRGMVINDAVAGGALTVPESPETSNAGMYMIIK